MTNSDRIPPHLREHIARAYAQGRLDASHPGDTWVHVGEFVRAVLRERPSTLGALHQLYDTMRDGAHAFGPATSRHPLPPRVDRATRRMNHSRCAHPATKTSRAHCRESAKMAGTWPHPAPAAAVH